LKVIVEKDKITKYLLNTDHPDGGSKAYFFIKNGFHASHWKVLEEALLTHFEQFQSSNSQEITPFGMKYILTGYIETPHRESVLIKSVWFKEKEADFLKLVTAYPF
tara:strand:- start:1007 stop:1324 length:318 start_codon:yes stop_codon:yes gene_type:complete